MSGLISVIWSFTALLSVTVNLSYSPVIAGKTSIDFILEAGGACVIISLLNLSISDGSP
jgi:hypothetical protein